MSGRHCRIGRVSFKNGGELRVLDGGGFQPQQDRLMSYARQQAKETDLVGFVLVSWTSDGGYLFGANVPADSPITPTLLPSWLADVVRREMIVPKAVKSALDSEQR